MRTILLPVEQSGLTVDQILRLVQGGKARVWSVDGRTHERRDFTDAFPAMDHSKLLTHGEQFTDGSSPGCVVWTGYRTMIEVEPTAAGVERARTWFLREVQRGKKRMTREDYGREARSLGCPVATFYREIWKVDAPADWRRDGRPPKKERER